MKLEGEKAERTKRKLEGKQSGHVKDDKEKD
jgi:hypothetical protein